MAKRVRLRDADQMFEWFFDRWYDEESRKAKEFKATRPDMLEVEEFVGRSAAEICGLTDEARSIVLEQVETMRKAADADWRKYLEVVEPMDLSWIEAFDTHYDLKRIEELLGRSDPADFSNDYLVTVCEFGAVLGTVMKGLLPRLEWMAAWPYWESSIFDSVTGNVIPVFHWGIKKFSTYGIDDGFSGKVEACLGMLRERG